MAPEYTACRMADSAAVERIEDSGSVTDDGGILDDFVLRRGADDVANDFRDPAERKVLVSRVERLAVDALVRVAKELNTNPSAVALAWVQTRPGVTSTIIGARKIDQLEQNLAALDITLDPSHVETLNTVSVPTLNFPATFLPMANSFMHSGATVNGEPSQLLPMMPKTDAERY